MKSQKSSTKRKSKSGKNNTDPMLRFLLVFSLMAFLTSCQKSIEAPKSSPSFKFEKVHEISHSQRGGPVKAAPACVLLDFDGFGFYEGCDATSQDIAEVIAEMKVRYTQWEMTFTPSESVYNSFPVGKRQRIVFTNSGIGFMGIAYIRSMPDGDEVNSALVWWYATRFYNMPNRTAARVASHEIGHTIGLYHQVDFCGDDYVEGDALTCPLMGLSVYATNVPWIIGMNTNCVTQDDVSVISKIVKRKR